MLLAARSMAVRTPTFSSRSARKRTINWMPKSMPRPTNSGMKATEIRLKRPTAARPTPMVMTRPARVVTRMQASIRTERVASHSIASTAASMAPPTSQARSAREANSSSDSGVSPVRRTTTPWAASRCRPEAMAWMASSALAPGSRSPKSSLACTSRMRRLGAMLALPWADISDSQEKNTDLPACVFSVASARPLSSGSSLFRSVCPPVTPCISVVTPSAMPRRLGSAARGPSTGWAAISWLVVSDTSWRDRKSRPFWAKNGPPSGRRTPLAMSFRLEILSARAAAAVSAISGVAPSITTTI